MPLYRAVVFIHYDLNNSLLCLNLSWSLLSWQRLLDFLENTLLPCWHIFKVAQNTSIVGGKNSSIFSIMWPQASSLKSLIYLRLPWIQEARARYFNIRNTPFMPLLMAIDVCHMAVCSVEHPRMVSPLLRAVFCIACSDIAQHAQE